MAAALSIARVYGEHHPDLASKWTLASADAAITAHERGDFSGSARLVDAMGRDDRISGVTATRIQAVLGLEFELQASEDGDGRSNKHVAKGMAKPWARFATEEVLREALKWRIHLGFGIGELIWRKERFPGDTLGPVQGDPQRLKIWHPQSVRWDAVEDAFFASTATGDVRITHGDGKWVIFGNGTRPWMNGACRSLWLLWLARQFGWRDLNLYGERTGQGILAAKVPATEVGERSQLVTQLRQAWRGLIVELPQGSMEGEGHDLELLETGSDEEVFSLILGKSDAAIAIRLIGQNLTTEVSGAGSFAATKSHERVRIDVLEADTDGLSTDTQGGILEPWAERKHGSRDLAPYPHWDASEPEDVKGDAEATKTFAEALGALKTAGKVVKNLDELAEKYGLELEDAPEPAPVALPAPGQPGASGLPPQGQQPPAAKPANTNQLAASALSAADPDPGFRNGQAYADQLVERGTQRASEALATDIANILRIVQASDSPAALRAGLTALYASAEPTEFALILERGRFLAELAGKFSVVEDLSSDLGSLS